MTPEFPDETVDDFPTPPREFTDAEDRDITVERAGDEAKDALFEMYLEFNPEDRAQGIPPTRDDAIQDWLDNVVMEDCLNVVAWHEGEAVGHAMLVPDNIGSYELAIFVLRAYQGAQIGTELVRSLLGWGQEEGIDKVWLTVERWNDPAVRLYEKVGFETTESQSFELEMGIRLG
ncbi:MULTISPECIES: GNAT family N-acetyltransferase [Salinibaculum]|uniref:GNAT family N-acetyltransferase n=1 Tax=Salinibaculum TaxID=2732368 RepID=UPI0030CD8269